jgi:hypothetical protein
MRKAKKSASTKQRWNVINTQSRLALNVFGCLHRKVVANAHEALDFNMLVKGSLKSNETIRLVKVKLGGCVVAKSDHKNGGTLAVPANTENLEAILPASPCIEMVLSFNVKGDSLRPATRTIGNK